ncbi:MAG: hypothetical protein JSU00_07475 [Acidobacteria bacterium]|nr:hypothetical protein [Acidobacteriota bacterium]
MQDFNNLKQQESGETPLFLFDCKWPSGRVEHWSTHSVSANGASYHARVLSHNLFELKSSLDDGADAAAKIALVLANADSYFSEIEWEEGFKGAQLTIGLVFYDLKAGAAVTDARIVFRGIAGPPDEMGASTFKVTFANRLNLQRVQLPETRIQRRCPWAFPTTAEQRTTAVDGGTKGTYSPFYRCGYSAGQQNGQGNLDGDGKVFGTCDYTRANCTERGMFDQDADGHVTRRFGGIEFVPASVLVRGYGESGYHAAAVIDNEARYNDFVPIVYGTAWYQPPIVFARNDGNLTRFEVLLGAGDISRVIKVVVNDNELPEAVEGTNMTGTGWFRVVSPGGPSGAFNSDFRDSAGNPLGDPYGSMAYLSVVVPNRINSGTSTPQIKVLAEGLKLPRFDTDGHPVDVAFTNNPAWVLLDVLRRSGWSLDDIDLASFANTAAYCDQPVDTKDLNGNSTTIPRYQCNLVVRKRRSAADIVRGVRNGSALLLTYGSDGKMVLRAENTIAAQQPVQSASTNSTESLDGGWPLFEFSDGSAQFSGIVRKSNGEPYLRFFSRSASESTNRFTVEFQDEFNEYQQDSLSLVDIDDVALMGQELTASLPALGLPNFDQAARILRLQLNKSITGNLYVEFGTSVRGFGLVPGDLIAITYEKEGLTRQPFRVVRVAPGVNYRTVVITAQYHDDDWYTGADIGGHAGRREPAFGVGIPRPLLGDVLDDLGLPQYSVKETAQQSSDGSYTTLLEVGFSAPSKPELSTAAIPVLSLTPTIDSTGGQLQGAQTLYYAVSGVDADGNEGSLSFIVRATIPAGSDTNKVRLTNLSFSGGTGTFRVYRGSTPAQLLQIATGQQVADAFVDEGVQPNHVASPPDENYDHANFYWRLEVQPEAAADITSANTIGNSTLHMLTNDNRGMVARITKGVGVGQERSITANDATTLTVSPKWDIPPGTDSSFVIVEPSWQFGSLTIQGPAQFPVPNRVGVTVEIIGRSANVHDQECAAELSTITRWQIGGAGLAFDSDTPPAPIFGLIPVGHGTVDLAGVGFSDLANTRTINAGTLTLLYLDELAGIPALVVREEMAEDASTILLTGSPTPAANDIIQVDGEIMVVTALAEDNASCTVTRASHGSSAQAHVPGTPVIVLQRRVCIVPFVRDFFGSPASGSYAFPVFLPDARIGAAELFMTNSRGDSPVTRISFTTLDDFGIRTLSGGQFSIQVDGTLSLQTDAAPPLLVDDTHAIRDIYATLRQAAAGDVQLKLRVDGAEYCDLRIPGGDTTASVDGFGMPALPAKSQLSLDIIGVPQAPTSFPGSDLTVTIRM